MPTDILLLDDELNVLEALQRSLRKFYRTELSANPMEALEKVRSHDYAVVVSDFKMPGMSGVEFLTKVRELSPDTVRILLTGHADVDASIAAVNQGNIFRFLTKPAETTVLTDALDAALEQHRLILAERELLHETLMGTVRVLVQVLSAIQPLAFGRTARIQLYVKRMANCLNRKDCWEFDAAAALSQLGCISIPSGVLRRYCAGEDLGEEEQRQFCDHPAFGANLLNNIPRLHRVAEMIEHQLDAYDPDEQVLPEQHEIMLGAQLLRVAQDFDRHIRLGCSWENAIRNMKFATGSYNPAVLRALEQIDPTPGAPIEGAAREHVRFNIDEQPFRSITDRVLQLLRN